MAIGVDKPGFIDHQSNMALPEHQIATPQLICGELLADLLEEAHRTDATAKPTANPFGDGRAGRRIVRILRRVLSGQSAGVPEVAE